MSRVHDLSLMVMYLLCCPENLGHRNMFYGGRTIGSNGMDFPHLLYNKCTFVACKKKKLTMAGFIIVAFGSLGAFPNSKIFSQILELVSSEYF